MSEKRPSGRETLMIAIGFLIYVLLVVWAIVSIRNGG